MSTNTPNIAAMQNAINRAARSSSVTVGTVEAYNLGGAIDELRALDNGAPLQVPYAEDRQGINGKHFGIIEAMNIAATAINMFDGMNMSTQHPATVNRFDAVTQIWNQGFLELTLYIGEFAIFNEQMLKERNPQDFPGVYDYEVSYPWGRWFVDTTMSTGRVPTQEEGRAELTRRADLFFGEKGAAA